MTVEERARECAKEYERLVVERIGDADCTSTWDEDSKWVHVAITTLVAQYLRDQIEDCAKLMDREVKGFQVLIDHAPTLIRAEDLKRVKHSIEVVANQIRALAEPTEERKEIER